MIKFNKGDSLSKFQILIAGIYSLPDDRFFSLTDLVSNQERFTMRALKGVRKNNRKVIMQNLVISLSWLTSIVNRLHVNLEDIVWKRFPGVCSYCGEQPCNCKKTKIKKRIEKRASKDKRPKNIKELQEMFAKIYPPSKRSLSDAGVHMAEEMGELSEAVNIYLGEHRIKYFEEIKNEIADYLSCLFGLANSANINLELVLEKAYYNNCHACHESPCSCNFNFIATFKS